MRRGEIGRMKGRLLITGGSHSEMPIIEAAQSLGWYVISTGNDEGAKGHMIADKYVKGDFSDKDFVYRLAKEEKVSAIISGANDFAYISAAFACDRLGLPGHDSYETARTIHIKNKFREVQREMGIKAPNIVRCRTIAECREAVKEIGFPLLVKPVDLTGGKGVKVCIELNETLQAFEDAMSITRESYVILEQYIRGSAHGITTLLKNQKVVYYIIDNEQYGLNKYLVLGACSPSDIPQHAEFSIIRDIEKIARHCNLVDGLFHTQFILDETDYPVMIDPCRRTPGDLYVLLAKYVTGVDYPAEIVKAECGEEIQDMYSMSRNFIARECIMTSKKGTIKEVHIEKELKQYIIYKHMGENKGIKIEQPMKHKAGILIMRFSSYREMMDILERFGELAWIEFEDDDMEG